MANKFTKEDYQKRIQISFPDWKFTILEFNGYKSPALVQCDNCGKLIHLKKGGDITRKINACSCYSKFKDYHDKIQYFAKIFNFKILVDGPATQKKEIQCLNCGTIMHRSLVSILNTPSHCDKCHKYREGVPHYTKEEVQERLDSNFNGEYELIEFKGMSKDALLKHRNCGFVFRIRELGDLFENRNRGCPKCYKFTSKGEQSVASFLEKNQINYIPQKTFSPLNKSKYRFDFYLPDFNIAIEYMGEQHYRDNHFFKESLETIQRRDLIKQQYCLDNNIELIIISYKELKNINAILTSRFNDYLEKE